MSVMASHSQVSHARRSRIDSKSTIGAIDNDGRYAGHLKCVVSGGGPA